MTVPGVFDREDDRKKVDLPTPEGVVLNVTLASVGDRILAFFIDVLILLVGATAMIIAMIGLSDGWAMALFFVLFFFLRSGYFLLSETLGRGRSLGKRVRRLRVVDADGAALPARAVVVRNLMREVDTFLPLTVVPLVPEVWPDAPTGLAFLVVLWLIAVLLLPLFDKKRRRLGDMVAGTLVLEAAEQGLLADLADVSEQSEPDPRVAEDDDSSEYIFTDEQLAHYGIYELQVLEDVLRKDDPKTAIHARITVSDAIRSKIGWSGEVHPRRFLTAFYVALRADLERRMLFGDRREDKLEAARRQAAKGREQTPTPPTGE